MKKSIYKKIAAIIAIIFSLLTIVEGSQVLLGITQPEFIVLTPLLIYNVIMGIIGLLVSGTIWLNHKKVMTYIKIVLIFVTWRILYFSGAAESSGVRALISPRNAQTSKRLASDAGPSSPTTPWMMKWPTRLLVRSMRHVQLWCGMRLAPSS